MPSERSFKVAIVGDTHANLAWLANLVIPYAKEQGCEKIIQCGDFGFCWRGGQSHVQLHKLNRLLGVAGLDLHFLPGNHEDHDLLERYVSENPTNPDGHYEVKPHIFYTGRVSSWEWAGRKLAAVGGAVSIDREWRQQHERATGNKIWWPQEVLTPEEVEQAHVLGAQDVLFTHDAPTDFPMKGLKPDVESHIGRQTISSIVRATCPKLQFHGHYHANVTYPVRHENGTCEVRGLDCDGSPRADGVGILDLGEACG